MLLGNCLLMFIQIYLFRCKNPGREKTFCKRGLYKESTLLWSSFHLLTINPESVLITVVVYTVPLTMWHFTEELEREREIFVPKELTV